MTAFSLIEAEHRTLRIALDRLRMLACTPVTALPEYRARAVLACELGGLQSLLRTHFENEERGGYFREISVQRADLASRVEHLAGMHDELRAQIADLRELAQRAGLPQVHVEILRFLDRLGTHERLEDELVQDAFCRDLGRGD